MKVLKFIVFALALTVLGIYAYLKLSNKNTNEFGLEVLSLVKNIQGNSVSLNEIEQSDQVSIDHAMWSELLQEHVTSQGKVDYQGFLSSTGKLNIYLDYLSENAPATNWSEEEKIY